ncbi:uncharacterized protein LOC111864842 [Cryptotermes secundus]|uniref:uncharacterized protein LOC111864842 n=1 Tax=Cryptotermes secundus TaxID=105785 RepID=UPI000CD7B819|nr:uncharacterized protein LOC111864842 [Cryptotermes secundus]
MRLLRGSTRHRAKTSRLSSPDFTGPGVSKTHLRANVLQREAETNRSALGGGQGEVPPHWEANSKNCNVKAAKRLLSVIFSIVFISLFIFVVTIIVKGAIQIEKRVADGFGSTSFPGGHQI